MTIVSNEMRFDLVSSTEESAYLNTADTGNLKVIFDAKAAWEGAILEFRADKDDTRYYRFLWDDDNGEAIISIIDDTDGIIQSIAWQLEKDVWYELCFCCASTHVAIEVDGTHILTDPQGKTVDNPEIKVKANTAFTGQYLYVDDFELRDTSEEQSGCPVCPDEDDEETDEDPDDDVTCKTTVCAGVNVPHRLLVV
ncbi:MAG: hypothetical protein MJA29_06615, partial [Candidatus Omnitrophica bacterium]|nr:hypothetical protein [Candidatus Omnitrophota bacterium]